MNRAHSSEIRIPLLIAAAAAVLLAVALLASPGPSRDPTPAAAAVPASTLEQTPAPMPAPVTLQPSIPTAPVSASGALTWLSLLPWRLLLLMALVTPVTIAVITRLTSNRPTGYERPYGEGMRKRTRIGGWLRRYVGLSQGFLPGNATRNRQQAVEAGARNSTNNF